MSSTPLAMRSSARTQSRLAQTPRSCSKPHAVQQPKQKLDRFITNRSAMDLSLASFRLQEQEDAAQLDSLSPSRDYQRALADNLLPEAGSRILAYKHKAPAPPEGFGNRLAALYNNNQAARLKKSTRAIPTAPDRILDAPELVDDFYINVLDWSSKNVIAVALGHGVYLWDANNGTCDLLTELGDEDYVSSVAWAPDGKHISVGTSSNVVQLWDVQRKKQVRNMQGHSARVSAAAWHGAILSTGSRDTTILNHDVRIREHVVSTFQGHQQEVCSLKYSTAGQLASGSNDNTACIWSLSDPTAPAHRFVEHQAAVKALAWCPWQSNLLATGGGAADRTIKFHNTATGALLSSVDAESQVSSLVWNPHDRELVSGHGYSKNDLKIWSYPAMKVLGSITGHTQRILHMALSPDGTTLCSASADESLRFHRVFAAPAAPAKVDKQPVSLGMRSIR